MDTPWLFYSICHILILKHNMFQIMKFAVTLAVLTLFITGSNAVFTIDIKQYFRLILID